MSQRTSTRAITLRRAMTLVTSIALITYVEAAGNWAQSLTQQALDSGFLSRLPQAVSVSFGLAKAEEGTEVRQLLSKAGREVRTFNVSVANHADVVIFNVNSHTGATVAYLLTPDGQLRKAVSYQAGHEARPLGATDAKAGLAREQRFWSARVPKAPVAPAAPAPAK
jgi:hypothetical protein